MMLGLSLLLASCRSAPRNFNASQAEKGVVRVFVLEETAGKVAWGYGSGFQIASDLVVTNHHVVEDSRGKTLVVASRISDTAIEILDATILHEDQELDFAILKVPGLSGNSLTLSEASIEKGSQAFAIGFPTSADDSQSAGSEQGEGEGKFIELVRAPKRGIFENINSDVVEYLDPTVSSGEVRKLVTRKWNSKTSTKLEVIDHDVNIGHGNSGGPLFDICGRVIGINTAGIHRGLADSVKNSSRATELIKFLEQKNISADTTSSPCDPSDSFSGWWFLAIIVALSVFAVILKLNWKQAKKSYTQFTKRRSSPASPQGADSPDGPIWKNGEIIDKQSGSKTSGAARQLPLDNAPSNSDSNSSLVANWLLVGGDSAGPVRIGYNQIAENGGSLSVGRKNGAADIVISNTSLSKVHATLSLQGYRLQIDDNHSSNGTKINGVRLTPGRPASLKVNDQITLGEVRLTLQSAAKDANAETSSSQGVTGILENPDHGIHLPFNLQPGMNLILGRKSAHAQLVIDNTSVSKTHASISNAKGGILITDLNSANGTKINNQRVQPGVPTSLKTGDILQLGEIHLTLR
ncbi:FHA domain-containing protein [bacterium]|nr:FHA domain-containing protein [Akkermansiaceae bacterium]MDB4505440.1 FHA domain-containing protein [bacterium]MDB4570659.1 FHA domain-containing protein [Akkermansiaceae bacterium]